MLELYFFILGIVNSVLLISIFIVRRNRLELVRRLGWVYLLMSVPAVAGIILAVREQAGRYAVFLVIFLAFLAVEWLFDYVLKIGFRDNWKKNWRWLVPYLVLYYAMNYGFVVMPWKTSIWWGLVMLALFAVQLITNLKSHSGKSG